MRCENRRGDTSAAGELSLHVGSSARAGEAFARYQVGQLLYERGRFVLNGAVCPEEPYGFAVVSPCWVDLSGYQEGCWTLPGGGACLEVLGLPVVEGRRWAVLLHRPELPFRAGEEEPQSRETLLRRAEAALAVQPVADCVGGRDAAVSFGLGFAVDTGELRPIPSEPGDALAPLNHALFRELYGRVLYLRWGKERPAPAAEAPWSGADGALGYGCVGPDGRLSFRAVEAAELRPGRPWLRRTPAEPLTLPLAGLRECRYLPAQRLTGDVKDLAARAEAALERTAEHPLRMRTVLDGARHPDYCDDIRVTLGSFGPKWVTVRRMDPEGTGWGTIVHEPPAGLPFHRGEEVGFALRRVGGRAEWAAFAPRRLSDETLYVWEGKEGYSFLADPGEPRHGGD